MEANTKSKSFADKITQEIAAEIQVHLDNLEIFITNSSFDSGQIESLRNFTRDEETRLNSQIKFLTNRHEQQIAAHEKIQIETHSKLFATHLRITRELNQSFETLLLSELQLFKRNIAGFILMLNT